ncbi:polysaccharide pyruvyl transferase family protein [Aerococcus kribbianus]|uniref:Polysaccharide pyruvyl transferase family protein n=1 Tax=Aerococcus kribbianus TaxID=2999064 RepID=A0A9X3FMV0_9LACT|nr:MULTISPECIES: polysaccharide pyruvyl transferase family protein [unclassified Aerococcus]MCZ0717174.1 polysaccharide pyruvyl transferase family protein [Aerococcus sp. YH-aer221]MCZ0725462.1 polysaccharide pyruvyl transferase family protein [Aerococcus sp. YH-aer222]
MKKVGIVTLLGYFNYGNRLQNYALKIILEKLGYEVDSLAFNTSSDFLMEEMTEEKPKRNLFGYARLVPRKIKMLAEERKYAASENKRTDLFKSFTDDYLNEQAFSQENEKNYDYFIVGSDQVWNPRYIKGQPQFMLPFTSKRKKIAYAASIGLPELPNEVMHIYKPYLADFNHISVREKEGSAIVDEMLDYQPEVVLDPTMLLAAEDWNQVAKAANNRPDEDYVLTYFLGGLDEEKEKIIDFYKKNYGLKVINMGQRNEKLTYETSPREFIDYIKNSRIFLTDSFHGVAFSIIYNKNFITFKRGNMNSRIDTILRNFKLEDRKSHVINDYAAALETIDFSDAMQILELEKQKSIQFLKNAMNLNEE